MSSDDVIQIKAEAKKNGLTSIVLGAVALLLSVILMVAMPDWFFLGGIFLVSASLVTLLVGYFKLREPNHSLEITPESIHYLHKRGHWHLPWSDIQRMGVPRVRRGVDHLDLEVVGFRLKQYDEFIDNISPRLATHLLMEQRPLLLQNPEENCATGTCYGNEFLEDTQFTLPSGKKLVGVQAMLATRMSRLRASLGYDLFIGSGELDREPSAFVVFLNNCNQARLQRDSDS